VALAVAIPKAAKPNGPKTVKLTESYPGTASDEELNIEDRHTDELVFALVGPVGSGATKTAALLANILREKYDYDIHPIRVSDLIKEFANVVGESVPDRLDRHARTTKLQLVGDKFREQFGYTYLAQKCIEKIAVHRVEDGDGYEKVGDQLVPKPRRLVHIIDSLKNPGEVSLLRQVYGDTFWLFGIFAPEEIRKERLLNMNFDEVELQKIMSVDEEEGVPHGQRVRETIHQADFFMRNDGQNDDRLRRVLERYLSILFNIKVNTPTQDEAGMYKAMSAASSSACLSRQVGAAIYSDTGELIGVGANDVPKRGGGLYTEDDGEHDHRCYRWNGKICHNDDRKSRLYVAIYEALAAARLLVEGAPRTDIEKALKKTDIKSLIEYSRAVHAEQEAILSVARGHKAGIVGATMYSTTYPCHSCAGLIVASGIERVIYIEPYAKSLAIALHRDAISVREGHRGSRVLFLQYEGVAPKNVIRLFNHGAPRKEDGKLLELDPRKASPVFPSPLDGFTQREQIIVHRVVAIEKRAKGATEGSGDVRAREPAPAELPLADEPKSPA
jgi:deoxycytidylate deaminase